MTAFQVSAYQQCLTLPVSEDVWLWCYVYDVFIFIFIFNLFVKVHLLGQVSGDLDLTLRVAFWAVLVSMGYCCKHSKYIAVHLGLGCNKTLLRVRQESKVIRK